MKARSNASRALLLPAISSVLVASPAALASYVLVEDFQSYTTGNANAGGSNAFTANGGPWQPRDGAGNIGGSGLIQIQNDGTTQHFAFGWGSGSRAAYLPTIPAIADGASGTYYFRIRTGDTTPDQSYGLSDVTTATNAGFGDFEVQVALVNSGGLPVFGARNGGTFQQLVPGLSIDTWYDVWLVVDNATDTYDVFFGTTGDPNTLGTQVADNFGFRNGTSASLGTFMTLDPSGNPADASADLDNIYFNAVAVPEPTVALLGGLGLLGLLRRRRN